MIAHKSMMKVIKKKHVSVKTHQKMIKSTKSMLHSVKALHTKIADYLTSKAYKKDNKAAKKAVKQAKKAVKKTKVDKDGHSAKVHTKLAAMEKKIKGAHAAASKKVLAQEAATKYQAALSKLNSMDLAEESATKL